MNTADFDYELPPHLIAQEPVRPRDSSRMLVLHRSSSRIEHRLFRELPDYLGSNDIVALNDTRVIPGRLKGRRHPGGGLAEVLLLAERADGLWEALVTPGRKLSPGREIVFGEGELRAEVVARMPTGSRLLRFSGINGWEATLARLGELPLPPYIHQPLRAESDYQTIYSQEPGSSAAPTAGLHFSQELLAAVQARVRALTPVTLHIGMSTFRPIRTTKIEDHEMHAEEYNIPEETANMITEALQQRRRVLAVGTSTARALEAAACDASVQGANPTRELRAGPGRTDLFILPGYQFHVLGALLTNFHMPRTTLLVMVCAFAGKDLILRAYKEAVAQEYRFLSFGDAMLII